MQELLGFMVDRVARVHRVGSVGRVHRVDTVGPVVQSDTGAWAPEPFFG